MGLKTVEYKDEDGRKFLVQVPDGYDDIPQSGIRIGPPELGSLNLPLEDEVKLNNQLYDRKLFTLADVRRRPEDIKGALLAVLKVYMRKTRNLYEEVDNE